MKTAFIFLISLVCLSACQKTDQIDSTIHEDSNKMVICHLNDDGKYVTKMIPEANWLTHEEHGDYLANDEGSCNINSGTFIDHRDGQEYSWVIMPDGKKWMSQNLNYALPDVSFCYNNDPINCEHYGRLYTWDDALTVCPDGWHLPSQAEWSALHDAYPNSEDAYTALIDGGSLGFDAFLGGERRVSFNGMEAPYFRKLGKAGYYWSRSEWTTSVIWGVSFAFRTDIQQLYGATGRFKGRGRSCRCVKDHSF